MVSNDEHSQESEGPQEDESGSARIDRMLREKGPALTPRLNGDGQLAPDVPSLHLGTGVHEPQAEHENPEDGDVSKTDDESSETEGKQQNQTRSDDGKNLPDLQGDHHVALNDGVEENGTAKTAPAIEVEAGRVDISRASPIKHEVADYGLVGDDVSEDEPSSPGAGDAVAPAPEAVASETTISEEEEVVDEPDSDPGFTPPHALTAGDDSAATAENDLLRIDVLANDISWSGINDLHIDSVSLTSGEGSVRIENGTLVDDPGVAYDHLAKGEQAVVTLSYRISDEDGLSDRGSVTITVNGANDGPVDLTIAGGSVDENAASGTLVATLSAVDADAGDSFTYAITHDPSGLFEIVGNEVRVAAGGDIDYEVAASQDVTISVTDSGGATYDEVVTLTVADVNEGPTDLVIDGGRVEENAKEGTVVAQVRGVDPDAGDRLSYSLTDDADGRFKIDTETGEVTVADGSKLDHEEAASHDITVRVTDSAGDAYDEAFKIAVGDENEAPQFDVGAVVDETTFSGSDRVVSDGHHTVVYGDELIAVDTSETFKLSGFVRAGDGDGGGFDPGNHQYFGFASYDVDGHRIDPWTVMRFGDAADTSLTIDLKPGDTEIHLNDVSGWQDGGQGYQRALAWWPYSNSEGESYDDYSYTRNVDWGANREGLWDEGGIDSPENGFKPPSSRRKRKIESAPEALCRKKTVSTVVLQPTGFSRWWLSMKAMS